MLFRSSATSVHVRNAALTPIEILETEFPVEVVRFELAADSGGPGRYRGGLGAEKVVQARCNVSVGTQMERVNCPPWGLEGGHSGMGNQVAMTIDGQAKEFVNGKVFNMRLKEGDTFTLRAGGGGGFGAPETREPERVARDVKQGYISNRAARETYRVACTDDGVLDIAETQRLRASA